jgi:hypothetical protein
MDAKPRLRKRPCSVCKRWFMPDSRVRHCQKTCSEDCGKKRAARRQADWRRKKPDHSEELRVRRAVRRAEQDGAVIEVRPRDGLLAKVPWAIVQTAMGTKNAVIIAFALRLLDRDRQTAIRVRIAGTSRSPGRLPKGGAQTAMEPRG